MKKKSVVLLSSGLDSTVNLYEAIGQSQVVLALTFDYGQRAAVRETAFAGRLVQGLGIPHKIISLPWFADFTRTSLIDASADIPVARQVAIDDREISAQSAKAVWVPNRNGIFLNIAAGFAEGMGADWIVPGFNAEEAVTFPDNSAEFMRATSANTASTASCPATGSSCQR